LLPHQFSNPHDKPTKLPTEDAKEYAKVTIGVAIRSVARDYLSYIDRHILGHLGITDKKTIDQLSPKQIEDVANLTLKYLNEAIVLAYPKDDNLRRGVKQLRGYNFKADLIQEINRCIQEKRNREIKNATVEVVEGDPVAVNAGESIAYSASFDMVKAITAEEYPGIEYYGRDLDSDAHRLYEAEGTLLKGFLSIDQVRDLCPLCADAMLTKGLSMIDADWLEQTMMQKARSDLSSAPEEWVMYLEDNEPNVLWELQKANPEFDCLETYHGINEAYSLLYAVPDGMSWTHDLYKGQVEAISAFFGYDEGLPGREVLEKAIKDIAHLHKITKQVMRNGRPHMHTYYVKSEEDQKRIHHMEPHEHEKIHESLYDNLLHDVRATHVGGTHTINGVKVSRVTEHNYAIHKPDGTYHSGPSHDVASYIHKISHDPKQVAAHERHNRSEIEKLRDRSRGALAGKREVKPRKSLIDAVTEKVKPKKKPEEKKPEEKKEDTGKKSTRSKEDVLKDIDDLHSTYQYSADHPKAGQSKPGKRHVANKVLLQKLHDELEAMGHSEEKHDLGKRSVGQRKEEKKPDEEKKRGGRDKSEGMTADEERQLEELHEKNKKHKPEEEKKKPDKEMSAGEKKVYDIVDGLEVGEIVKSKDDEQRFHIKRISDGENGQKRYQVTDTLTRTSQMIPSRSGVAAYVVKALGAEKEGGAYPGSRAMTDEEKKGMENNTGMGINIDRINDIVDGKVDSHRGFGIEKRGDHVYVVRKDGNKKERIIVPGKNHHDAIGNAFQLADHLGKGQREGEIEASRKAIKDALVGIGDKDPQDAIALIGKLKRQHYGNLSIEERAKLDDLSKAAKKRKLEAAEKEIKHYDNVADSGIGDLLRGMQPNQIIKVNGIEFKLTAAGRYSVNRDSIAMESVEDAIKAYKKVVAYINRSVQKPKEPEEVEKPKFAIGEEVVLGIGHGSGVVKGYTEDGNVIIVKPGILRRTETVYVPPWQVKKKEVAKEAVEEVVKEAIKDKKEATLEDLKKEFTDLHNKYRGKKGPRAKADRNRHTELLQELEKHGERIDPKTKIGNHKGFEAKVDPEKVKSAISNLTEIQKKHHEGIMELTPLHTYEYGEGRVMMIGANKYKVYLANDPKSVVVTDNPVSAAIELSAKRTPKPEQAPEEPKRKPGDPLTSDQQRALDELHERNKKHKPEDVKEPRTKKPEEKKESSNYSLDKHNEARESGKRLERLRDIYKRDGDLSVIQRGKYEKLHNAVSEWNKSGAILDRHRVDAGQSLDDLVGGGKSSLEERKAKLAAERKQAREDEKKHVEDHVKREEKKETKGRRITVTSTNVVNRTTANIADLAADYKARGMGKRDAFNEFVKDRSLKPDIDASAFYKVFESVSPSVLPSNTKTREVDFIPTHTRVSDGSSVMAEPANEYGITRVITQHGKEESDHESNLKSIDSGTKISEEPKRKPGDPLTADQQRALDELHEKNKKNHPEAISRKSDIETDKRYTVWHKVGDNWLVERSMYGPGAQEVFDKEVTATVDSTRPYALFEHGFDPNKKDESDLSKKPVHAMSLEEARTDREALNRIGKANYSGNFDKRDSELRSHINYLEDKARVPQTLSHKEATDIVEGLKPGQSRAVEMKGFTFHIGRRDDGTYYIGKGLEVSGGMPDYKNTGGMPNMGKDRLISDLRYYSREDHTERNMALIESMKKNETLAEHMPKFHDFRKKISEMVYNNYKSGKQYSRDDVKDLHSKLSSLMDEIKPALDHVGSDERYKRNGQDPVGSIREALAALEVGRTRKADWNGMIDHANTLLRNATRAMDKHLPHEAKTSLKHHLEALKDMYNGMERDVHGVKVERTETGYRIGNNNYSNIEQVKAHVNGAILGHDEDRISDAVARVSDRIEHNPGHVDETYSDMLNKENWDKSKSLRIAKDVAQHMFNSINKTDMPESTKAEARDVLKVYGKMISEGYQGMNNMTPEEHAHTIANIVKQYDSLKSTQHDYTMENLRDGLEQMVDNYRRDRGDEEPEEPVARIQSGIEQKSDFISSHKGSSTASTHSQKSDFLDTATRHLVQSLVGTPSTYGSLGEKTDHEMKGLKNLRSQIDEHIATDRELNDVHMLEIHDPNITDSRLDQLKDLASKRMERYKIAQGGFRYMSGLGTDHPQIGSLEEDYRKLQQDSGAVHGAAVSAIEARETAKENKRISDRAVDARSKLPDVTDDHKKKYPHTTGWKQKEVDTWSRIPNDDGSSKLGVLKKDAQVNGVWALQKADDGRGNMSLTHLPTGLTAGQSLGKPRALKQAINAWLKEDPSRAHLGVSAEMGNDDHSSAVAGVLLPHYNRLKEIINQGITEDQVKPVSSEEKPLEQKVAETVKSSVKEKKSSGRVSISKKNVKAGDHYIANVSGKKVPIRIIGESRYGGWDAENTKTGRRIRIKTAGRLTHTPEKLRELAGGSKAPEEKKAAPSPEKGSTSSDKPDGDTEGSVYRKMNLSDFEYDVKRLKDPSVAKTKQEKKEYEFSHNDRTAYISRSDSSLFGAGGGYHISFSHHDDRATARSVGELKEKVAIGLMKESTKAEKAPEAPKEAKKPTHVIPAGSKKKIPAEHRGTWAVHESPTTHAYSITHAPSGLEVGQFDDAKHAHAVLDKHFAKNPEAENFGEDAKHSDTSDKEFLSKLKEHALELHGHRESVKE